ncbi:hypothetical protein BDV28DRAFT_65272 [Aspergillus coremiiformis]|uniref:Uncharacterized protein n=1 Tax=Aspergillus coremiiformis TaxID=138285 RepID=A0A5N6ZHC9_9EURO|nr:hypothetical protein BDV28DRAFT_65272 [Aspergillus coremiiformis]
MKSTLVFVSTFVLSLFLFEASTLVPPRLIRQVLVFAFLFSLPFLISYHATLAVDHYARFRTRRPTRKAPLSPRAFTPR